MKTIIYAVLSSLIFAGCQKDSASTECEKCGVVDGSKIMCSGEKLLECGFIAASDFNMTNSLNKGNVYSRYLLDTKNPDDVIAFSMNIPTNRFAIIAIGKKYVFEANNGQPSCKIVPFTDCRKFVSTNNGEQKNFTFNKRTFEFAEVE